MNYIPVLNSSLQSIGGEFDSYGKSFSDVTLKVGIVLKKYETDDDNNISKAYPEYDVLAISQEQDMGTASVIYKRCQVLQSFGGIADFTEHKLRQPEKDPLKPKEGSDPREENGSVVLLLCLHGSQDNGIILGALQHPKRETTLTPDKEHHLEGEFNGVNWQINKDGELTLTYKSKTDNDGNPQDETSGGSFVKISKDGSIEINDGDAESIKLDKPGKNVSLSAGSNVSTNSGAETSISAGAAVNITAGADMIAEATGQVGITAGSAFDLKAQTEVKIDGLMVDIKGKTMLKMQALMMQFDGLNIQVGTGGKPAIVFDTKYIGVGNLGGPVISRPIGPFSTRVFIGV